LQVIDHDEVEAVLGLEPPRLGADVHDAGAGLVVDVDLGLRQAAEGAADPVPLAVVDLAEAEAVRVDPGLHREQPLDELVGAHLHAEDADRVAVADGGAVGHAQRHACFSHARPGGQDDQVGLLEAAGEGVHVAEAGGDADEGAPVLLEQVDLVEEAVQHLGDGDEVLGLPLLGDVEDRLLAESRASSVSTPSW
jgi:hypothetical protein